LALAAPYLTGKELLLLDGDVLFSPALLALLLHTPHSDALLVRTEGTIGEEEVKVIIDHRHCITRIGKDIAPSRAFGESIGLAKFSRRITEQLFSSLNTRKDRREFYEASFQEVIDGGACVRAVPCEPHPCIEIDTPEDLAEAEALAAHHKL
jgi:choline kinase